MAQALGLTHGAIAISWDKNYVPFPYWPPTAQFGKILSGQSIISRSPIQQNNRIVLEKSRQPALLLQSLLFRPTRPGFTNKLTGQAAHRH